MKEMANKSGVTVIKRLEKINQNWKMLCRCPVCGESFEMWASHFYRGSNACECQKTNWDNERLYSIWTNMKTRCYNPNNSNFDNYGARGIKICDEWIGDYATFKKWAWDSGYSDELTIDRIDNDGDYEPNNCKWSTMIEQANNKRSNINLNIYGEVKSMKRWCEESGLIYKTEHTHYRVHNDLSRLQNKLEEIHK